jgi:GNAT superfamily N-acetyltransferase
MIRSTVDGVLMEGEGRPFIRTATDEDLDWMVERHDAIYEQELGWGPGFIALVRSIVDAFRASHDPGRERAWVAELDGERVGMVMLVRLDDATAKLRILLVEPEARGRGIGSALVTECLDFARTAGYRRVTLWTDSGLDPARHIYEREGFRLVGSEAHHLYGQGLVAETWEIGL